MPPAEPPTTTPAHGTLLRFPGLEHMGATRLFIRDCHVVLEFTFDGEEFEAFFRPELAEVWGRAFLSMARAARRERGKDASR